MPAPLAILAAGSLRAALTSFAQSIDPAPQLAFGPAGLLRQAIERGRACDVFLSANMGHPEALAAAAGVQARAFASNPLCVVVRPGATVRPDTLLDHLLDPATRVGTSTPGADPSGDYAMELFTRADMVREGTGRILRAKALQVVGAAIPVAGAPTKEGGIAGLFQDGVIDAFICYRTTALALAPGLVAVTPPPELAVTARYGVVALRPSEHATGFVHALFGIGQALLARFGFDPA